MNLGFEWVRPKRLEFPDRTARVALEPLHVAHSISKMKGRFAPLHPIPVRTRYLRALRGTRKKRQFRRIRWPKCGRAAEVGTTQHPVSQNLNI
jgi:hypothetical protein